MDKSRTKNTIRNVRSGIIVQVINKIMAFVVRSVFIAVLNTEYLGVNGLFHNILTVLSFAELGIGTAIIFSMYKPVADNDIPKLKSLMKLYKKCYITIGVIVFALGLAVIPFMNIIVKDVPNIKESIIVIYLLFLFNTASSYFFTYKKSIISAHQQQIIINRYDSVFYLVKSIFEIAFLYLTKNYIIYLSIQIFGTFIENMVISLKADKMFPYIKEKDAEELPEQEKKSIFENVKSLVVYKVGATIMNGTDNIIISSIINTATVGLCSNYVLVIDSIKGIIVSAYKGITASVGNLNVQSDTEKKERVFYELTFITYWLYAFCAIAFVVLANPFVLIWTKKEAYVMGLEIPIALAFSFYLYGFREPAYTFRVTFGFFEEGKMAPYIAAVANLVSSIILGKIFGTVGVYIGTSVTQLMSYSWIDPYIIHKHGFNTPSSKYFKRFAVYTLIFMANMFITYMIADMITVKGIMGFLAKGVVAAIIPNVIFYVIYRKTDEFIAFKNRILRLLKKTLKIKG